MREKRIYTEVFYLIYPLLVLFMSLRIARERLWIWRPWWCSFPSCVRARGFW